VAGVNYFYVEAARALPAGEHQVRMEFAYAGGGLGKGGEVTLYLDGEKVGEGAIPMTQAMVFSADDGCDVGEDSGAPVSQDYGSRGNAFNGTVKGVQLAIGDAAESSDHLGLAGGCHPHRDGTAVGAWGRPPVFPYCRFPYLCDIGARSTKNILASLPSPSVSPRTRKAKYGMSTSSMMR
jgi:hypothetical protein